MSDEHDLQRFVDAQEDSGTYAEALEELRAVRKTTHWIWYVFPQIAGLGKSETARTYAIGSLEEARAYLEHPLLGPRLRESSQACSTSTAAPPAGSSARSTRPSCAPR
jgi:uncharacterized protein (DUF1810 family)